MQVANARKIVECAVAAKAHIEPNLTDAARRLNGSSVSQSGRSVNVRDAYS